MVKLGTRNRSPRSVGYTTKIIKAGALLADTKILLSHWDPGATGRSNLDRIRRQNVFGKASRSRVEDILAIFRQRYLSEQQVTSALVVLVKNQFSTASLDRILYFHSARSDRLLYDVVTEILLTMQAHGISGAHDAERFVDQCLTYGALLDYAGMCDKADETGGPRN